MIILMDNLKNLRIFIRFSLFIRFRISSLRVLLRIRQLVIGLERIDRVKILKVRVIRVSQERILEVMLLMRPQGLVIIEEVQDIQ